MGLCSQGHSLQSVICLPASFNPWMMVAGKRIANAGDGRFAVPLAFCHKCNLKAIKVIMEKKLVFLKGGSFLSVTLNFQGTFTQLYDQTN